VYVGKFMSLSYSGSSEKYFVPVLLASVKLDWKSLTGQTLKPIMSIKITNIKEL
jgi:hypothetical protein